MATSATGLSLRRRLVLPLAILLVAGGIAWWYKQRDEAQLDRVRGIVPLLTQQVLEGRDPLVGITAADPIILRDLRAGIFRVVALNDRSQPNRNLAIDAKVGDLGPYADGSASHTVVIRRDGIERLGIRFQVGAEDEPLRVIGVWHPGEEQPTPAEPPGSEPPSR